MRNTGGVIAVVVSCTIGLAACSSGNGSLVPATSHIGTLSSATRSLKCFAQDGGTCTISKDGAVTLKLPNPPAADAAAGVYFASDNSLNGTALADIRALSFTLSGPYQAGSPRVTIPATYNGTATNVFIYPEDCSFSSSQVNWTVDPVSSPNSAGNYCMELQGHSAPLYSSTWNGFNAAYPGIVIAGPPLFMVDADNASGGTWTLTGITSK